jgi:cell division septal protein FtsQ
MLLPKDELVPCPPLAVDVVAPALAMELARVEYVDLRYTNGFAVGWRQGPPANLAAVAQVSPDRG